MKLLVIAPFYRWFIRELVNAQSKYVDEIHVLVHHNPIADISNYVPFGGYFSHLRLYTRQKIIHLNNIPPNVRVHLIDTLYFIPDGRNPRLGDKLFKKFKNYIRENKIEFDIIHAHFTYPQGYVAVKLSKEFNVPVVVTLHENGPHLNSVLNNVGDKARYVWKNADMLIRVNKKDIPLFIKYGADPHRIIAIPNGFNPQKLPYISKEEARKLLDIPNDVKVVFNLARLYPEKGHEYLIKAMSLVKSRRNDVLCFIGGSGPLKNKLQKQINDLGLQDYVKLLGYVPNDELALWMNAADLFVLPSLSESFGVVQIEAMACGVPVVATINGGSEEIITSEDYGLLCPPADLECLAEKILIALEKEWNKEKIRKYAERFTWDTIARRTLEVYESVLDEKL